MTDYPSTRDAVPRLYETSRSEDVMLEAAYALHSTISAMRRGRSWTTVTVRRITESDTSDPTRIGEPFRRRSVSVDAELGC